MKAITKFIGILLVSLLVTACATTFKVAEKYNLDKELKEATDISNFRIDSWESIDYQSLILKTDLNDYYLIVLQRPAENLPFSESVGITFTADKIKPGYDDIIVAYSGGSESYIIHKMYKLKDRAQATEIKKRLKSS